MTGQKLAQQIGLSQNYVAKRLRDEAPFTLDDVAKIAFEFGLDAHAFVRESQRHYERVLKDLDAAYDEIQYADLDPSVETPSLALVADEGDLEPGDLEQ